MKINSNTVFGIIGGDLREFYAAREIAKDGFDVYISGFENCRLSLNTNLKQASALDCARLADIVILPLPVYKNGEFNAVFSNKKIELSAEIIKALSGKRIFCGMKKTLTDKIKELDSELITDCLSREDFAVLNAVPTAEGAIELALRLFPGTIHSAKCLVCGYGRIGKILSEDLKALGASVTVSARSPGDLAQISARAMKTVHTDRLKESGEYDIIFNTVPALVLDGLTLAKIACNALVIDLASLPGGVDFEACGRLGIEAVRGLSLPGKTAPLTAGRIVKDTIFKISEEG